MAKTARSRCTGGLAWLAALTMTVLAVTPLLSIFHQVSARHTVCEHGELVESGHGEVALTPLDGAETAATSRDAQNTSRPGVRAESDAANHGHDHCSVGTLARNNVALPRCPDAGTVSPEIVQDCDDGREVAYVPSILVSAPKTSPPPTAS
jgi:ABC-type glutathione transport system ATPase component